MKEQKKDRKRDLIKIFLQLVPPLPLHGQHRVMNKLRKLLTQLRRLMKLPREVTNPRETDEKDVVPRLPMNQSLIPRIYLVLWDADRLVVPSASQHLEKADPGSVVSGGGNEVGVGGEDDEDQFGVWGVVRVREEREEEEKKGNVKKNKERKKGRKEERKKGSKEERKKGKKKKRKKDNEESMPLTLHLGGMSDEV